MRTIENMWVVNKAFTSKFSCINCIVKYLGHPLKTENYYNAFLNFIWGNGDSGREVTAI